MNELEQYTENIKCYPTKDINAPAMNDILLGRGARVNQHPGNINFRRIIQLYKDNYITERANAQKHSIKTEILQKIKTLSPPGRFIIQDSDSMLWHDVGEDVARRKVSQALRENASALRKNIIKNDFALSSKVGLEDSYHDIKDALEYEISKKESVFCKKIFSSLQEKDSTNSKNSLESTRKNIELNTLLPTELSISEVEKVLSDYTPTKMKSQNTERSMTDLEISIGTFCLEDMSLSHSSNPGSDSLDISHSSNLGSDSLDKILICFKLDKIPSQD